MSSINPFSGYLAQGTSIDRAQAADKTRQARRAQVLAKNVAARDDELEHQVESTDVVDPTHDQNAGGQQQKKSAPKKKQGGKDEGETPRLDIVG